MDKSKEKKCECPYCDTELEKKCFEPDFCDPCETKFLKCEKCGQMYAESFKTCPQCK